MTIASPTRLFKIQKYLFWITIIVVDRIILRYKVSGCALTTVPFPRSHSRHWRDNRFRRTRSSNNSNNSFINCCCFNTQSFGQVSSCSKLIINMQTEAEQTGSSSSSSSLSTIRHDNSFLSFNKSKSQPSKTETALVILNCPGLSKESIQTDSMFQRLWNVSSLRVCADGGANRLFDAVNEKKLAKEYIPNFVRGDLDSLRDDVRSFYSGLDCDIEQDFDQDTNDLDKCLQAIYTRQGDMSTNYIVCVFGAFGGRFDQEMASINALYNWQGKFSRVLLFTEDTCAFLLPSNVRNEIIINDEIEGPVCGMIPIGAPAKSVTTSGLKWNLNSDISEFGGMVSTSNQVLPNEIVSIETSSPLVWTTEIKCHG